MGFQLVAFELLGKHIRESINTEIKSHNLDPRNLKKSLSVLYYKHPERSIQCQYLLVVLDSLSQSELKDKARVLNAATYYIRQQIFESYQGTLTSFFLSPVNSTLFNSLSTSLNLNNDNLPDSKDLLDMYVALESFMQSHVYEDCDSRKGYLDPEKQLFSAGKIKGYKVEKVLKDLVKKNTSYRLQQIDATKEQNLVRELASGKKAGIGIFGLFVGATTPLNPVDEERTFQYP